MRAEPSLACFAYIVLSILPAVPRTKERTHMTDEHAASTVSSLTLLHLYAVHVHVHVHVCVRQAPAAVIEEPTHLASLLQEEPLELAAPEELFSKSGGTADDAEEEAAIGQGATALMLDA
eukprot:COSAG06_NODE_26968_length_604_cov_0.491089_2_plen_119_part_01